MKVPPPRKRAGVLPVSAPAPSLPGGASAVARLAARREVGGVECELGMRTKWLEVIDLGGWPAAVDAEGLRVEDPAP